MLFYFPNESEIGLAPINRFMNNLILSSKRQITEGAKWLDEKVQPNTFVVATLKQSIVSTHEGFSRRVMGCRDIYHGSCRQALCRFSKTVFGRTNWMRHRNRIPGFATLEGNGCGRQLSRRHSPLSLDFVRAIQPSGKKVRYHYNICSGGPIGWALMNSKTSFGPAGH